MCPLPGLRIECRQQHSSYGVGLAGASVTSDQLSRVSKPATLARLTGDRIAIRFAEQNQDGQRGVRLYHRLAESGKASCVTQASPVAEFPGPRKAANSRSVKRPGKTGGSLTEAKCWAVRFPVGEGRPAPTEPNKNEISLRKILVRPRSSSWRSGGWLRYCAAGTTVRLPSNTVRDRGHARLAAQCLFVLLSGVVFFAWGESACLSSGRGPGRAKLGR